MTKARFLAVALAALSLGGCASMTHYTTERTLGPTGSTSDVFFVDAKQRAVYSNRDYDGRLRVCAEPSPDALSALAASGALGISNPSGVSGNGALSVAEAAGSIGLRTQSIQLMRDAMYRICEGYSSGALSKGSFETLHRRLQSSMVAILAIEQLTGTVKAQQIVLGGNSSTGAAEQIAKLTQATSDARTTLDAADADAAKASATLATLKAESEAATKAAEGAPDGDPKKAAATAAKTKYDDQAKVSAAATEKATKAKAAYQAIDDGRRAALSGTTSAGASGQFGATSGGQLSDAAASSISAAVQQIVDSTLDLQFSNEFCTTVLVAAAYGDIRSNGSAVTKCEEILEETRQRIAAETTYLETATTYYIAHPDEAPKPIPTAYKPPLLLKKAIILAR